MMQVGFVGWRGMVGSVLMQRMQAERDFDPIEPVFFTTSQVGGDAPAAGDAVGCPRHQRGAGGVALRSPAEVASLSPRLNSPQKLLILAVAIKNQK